MSVSDDLHIMAQGLGGARTFSFSQGTAFKVAPETEWVTPTKTWKDQGKMYKMVLRNNNPMGGVCATVCAFWIVFHAKQGAGEIANAFTRDRSVWDYLFNDGGLNLGAAQNITCEHLLSTGNQLNYFENFMAKFDIKRRDKSISGIPIANVFVALSNSTVFQCADIITRIGGYKLIQLKQSLDGSGSGHMVSAWCDGQDVVFMDPNMGEFWFPNVTSFKVWLASFFAKTYLRNNRYKSMRVHNYA
ncbi:YopT-type cysteine protease domain-containing protein [Mangrovitalea sediminis]|uniref:YopT-type cysteine protease domain-containing protein n=1 Tax=Mangrovitalea sediminis TaxID=1982043 RepID=UPI000BE51754|nr:YopT-type cysteine protease domain-containing protein [Mangrovitalea sediminis]